MSYDVNHPFNFMLYSMSGERFEKKVKLKWPNPFNEDDPHPGFYIFGPASINDVLCLYIKILVKIMEEFYYAT